MMLQNHLVEGCGFGYDLSLWVPSVCKHYKPLVSTQLGHLFSTNEMPHLLWGGLDWHYLCSRLNFVTATCFKTTSSFGMFRCDLRPRYWCEPVIVVIFCLFGKFRYLWVGNLSGEKIDWYLLGGLSWLRLRPAPYLAWKQAKRYLLGKFRDRTQTPFLYISIEV
mgnify:CR=1 FL=1